MKKSVLLAATASVLAITACTPTAGVPPVRYIGESTNIITTIAQTCTQLQPGKGYNFYTVDAITTNGVTCVANPLLGYRLLVGNAPVRLVFTALQNGQITSVAGSANTGIEYRNNIDAVFQQLDKTFQRAP